MTQYSREGLIASLKERRAWYMRVWEAGVTDTATTIMCHSAIAEIDHTLMMLEHGGGAGVAAGGSPAETAEAPDQPDALNVFDVAREAIHAAFDRIDAGIPAEQRRGCVRLLRAMLGGLCQYKIIEDAGLSLCVEDAVANHIKREEAAQ